MLALIKMAAAAVAALAVAGGGATQTATTPSGLRGVVMRGPITPVCRSDYPCEGPAPNVTLSFSVANRVFAHAKTNEHGRYRVLLPRGIYSVRTDQRPFGTIPSPATVRVRPERIDRVDFSIDTGIR